MGRLYGFKYQKIIKILKNFGFEFQRHAVGSHEIWYNSKLKRYTTIPHHAGEMPEGTLRAILKQCDISPNKFLNKKK